MGSELPFSIRWNQDGLVVAVVQDEATGEVLMVAWMNEEALRRTLETGEAHFWSRSRRELWHKGATSGNYLYVREIRADCDGDALLLRVAPQGPACHTGHRSCFFRGTADIPSGRHPADVLNELFAVILSRKEQAPPDSYTAHLFQEGEDAILQKLGEEAVEVILAAKGQGNERVVAEVADLLYHLLVLLAARGLTLTDVEKELARRFRERRTREART